MKETINEKAKALYNAALETNKTKPGSNERREAIDKENIAEEEWIRAKNRIRRKYSAKEAREIIGNAAREGFRRETGTEREKKLEIDKITKGSGK
jgi:RNase P subunit RPR2